MQNQYEKIFTGLREIHPPAQLASGILMCIQTLQRRSRRQRFAVGVIAAGVSALAAIPAFAYAAVEFSQSGFGQYVSLLFSDGAAVLDVWQDFGLLLAESVPWASLTVALASAFMLVGSLRLMSRNFNGSRWTPMHN